VRLLIDSDRVARSAKLLCGSEARRARTNHRDFLAGAKLRWLRPNPALQESALHNIFFVLLDGHRGRVDPQHAGSLAGRRTDPSGELRKVIGRVQLAYRIFPAPAIHQIVPVGNQIADRTSRLAEGDAAIHAARTLPAKLLFGEILIN